MPSAYNRPLISVKTKVRLQISNFLNIVSLCTFRILSYQKNLTVFSAKYKCMHDNESQSFAPFRKKLKYFTVSEDLLLPSVGEIILRIIGNFFIFLILFNKQKLWKNMQLRIQAFYLSKDVLILSLPTFYLYYFTNLDFPSQHASCEHGRYFDAPDNFLAVFSVTKLTNLIKIDLYRRYLHIRR